MKDNRLQAVRLERETLAHIKGGYKYVSGAADGASFIGSSVDIRLNLTKPGHSARFSNGVAGLKADLF